ncbi:hypothetical protein B0T25DRAFT_511309 [Lasiosphaeria hispida]|uniref:Uncharacterized protein n=1 Tax=Lasiosphaeria hispida TaxID=260671 RepID=A0AAJ0H7U5_9PEZI|nr:hypothetical protein B0T25DRAFT_511309 [Lasiosphaeria hispida]
MAAAALHQNPEISVQKGVLELMDKHGDMMLFVGHAKFLVCSRTLFRASSVVEKAHHDHMASQLEAGQSPAVLAQQAGRLRLARPGVTPAAVRAILTIIHGSPMDLVPKFENRKLLHDILIVTDHYKMTECLAPVAVKWIRKVYNKDAVRYDDIAAQLWICHKLGHLRCLKQTLAKMIVGGRLNRAGQLVGYGATDDQPYAEMQTITTLGIIAAARTALVEQLLQLFEQAYARLEASPKTATISNLHEFVCKADKNQAKCDLVMLGALVKAIKAENWEVLDISASPRQLHRRMMKISMDALDRADVSGVHRGCEPLGSEVKSLEDLAQWAVDQIPLDESDFRRRSTALGFDSN